MSGTTPWDWLPDLRPWAEAFARAADEWEPPACINIALAEFRAAIGQAAATGSQWILHPCMSRLTQATAVDPARDVALAAWVAGHTGCEGEVELMSPTALWSAAGDGEMPTGRYLLGELGATMMERGPVKPALDLWCRSTGIVTEGSWASLDQRTFNRLEPELTRSIHQFLGLMSGLERAAPPLLGWINAATRVIRPLVPVADFARSSHDPEVPGMIEADLSRGPTQMIELIAHESAHLHLRAAQAAAPLIDPNHDDTYRSPLRPEPRPLMGILLAYHALAYICAALQAAAATALLNAETTAQALVDLAGRRDDARRTTEEARGHFTMAGAEFLERTHQVADFAHA
jgi:hypothetical protein